jgi:hypothetical protein
MLNQMQQLTERQGSSRDLFVQDSWGWRECQNGTLFILDTSKPHIIFIFFESI